MPIQLDSQSPDFSERFRAFLGTKRETAQDVDQRVRAIIDEVKAYGDRALLQLTLEFDRLDFAKVSMRVTQAEIDDAEKSCKPEALAALKLARERIEAYHLRQKPADERYRDALGVELGSKWTAIEAVGHVPGRQHEEEAGKEERQAGVAQVQRAVGDGVDLPGHRHRLRLRAQDGRHARQLVPPEIPGGKCLHAAPRLVYVWSAHGQPSGYIAGMHRR